MGSRGRIIKTISIIGLLVLSSSSAANANSSSTTVTQTLLPGLLVLANQPAAVMNNATTNIGSSTTATGLLGLASVTDSRGTGAGWSLTATTTSFVKVNTPIYVSGSAGSLVTSGTYTGSASGIYTVTIVNGGTLGTATYSVSGLETQAATATGVGVPLGTRGLSLTFAGATYSPGNQWTIEVDTIPASNLTITPSAVTAILGSATGVTSGSAYTYSTGSDPATIMTATSSYGLGEYSDTPSLSLNIPAGTKAGAYVATVTETVN